MIRLDVIISELMARFWFAQGSKQKVFLFQTKFLTLRSNFQIRKGYSYQAPSIL